jgi:hypothetical protein
MKRLFKYWTRDDLYTEIGLDRTDKSTVLDQWLNNEAAIDAQELALLERLAKRAEPYIDNWNEVELREKFIYKVTDLVDFDMPQYKCTFFAERYLSVTVKHVTLYGFADWMVASGMTKPKSPYFFIHEYKPETEKQIDGRGQLLAIMLATQELNKDNAPMYGCFIHGRMWFFVVLIDLQYAISRAYDATQLNDLTDIVKILKRQKEIIVGRLKK